MINTTHKRKYIRINSNIVAKIIYNNKTSFGIIKNISAGGINLSTKNTLAGVKLGDIIELNFKYKDTFYDAFGIITRDRTTENPFGVKFVFKEDKNKLNINTQILEDYFSDSVSISL